MPLPPLSRRHLLGSTLLALGAPADALVEFPALPPVRTVPNLPTSAYITLELHRAPGEDNGQWPADLQIPGFQNSTSRQEMVPWSREWRIVVSGPGFLDAVLPAVAAWCDERPCRDVGVGHVEDVFKASSLQELEETMQSVLAYADRPLEEIRINVFTHWDDALRNMHLGLSA